MKLPGRKDRNGKKDKWVIIESYPITEYRCGARAGDRVRLRRELIIEDQSGRKTGDVFPAGGVWTVLRGAKEEPRALWLRNPRDEVHTWDDDESFWKWFEKGD